MNVFDSEVSKWLRKSFMSGDLRPADVISENIVQREVGRKVSKIEIRKVLTHYEANGIVKILPKKGTFVCHIDKDQLRQVWDMRVATEEFMVVQLACKRVPDLEDAMLAQNELKELVEGITEQRIEIGERTPIIIPGARLPTVDERVKFLELDHRFHEAIGIAAGYPQLAHDVDMMRLKLMLAGTVDADAHRMDSTVREHFDLLQTLNSDGRSGIRPDINAVKLAYRVHVRNAARHWWRIEQTIQPNLAEEIYGQNYVLDIPDFHEVYPNESLDTENELWELRIATELLAVKKLMQAPDAIHNVLTTLLSLNANMSLIANQKTLSPDDLAKFDSFDVSFHTAISFAGGLLFAEEAIVFAWHRLGLSESTSREQPDLTAVVSDHDKIIQALKTADGTADEKMKDHLTNARARRRN
ncbi:MAG: FCD domain-containing protein [Planctomycetales bacterium]|nr:FCD domain-containing protein [Planctomycetales bacterium]